MVFSWFSTSISIWKCPEQPSKKQSKMMPRDPLKHLINKGQWEMVLPCHCIQSPIIDTHPPTYSEVCRDIFSLIILHHHDPRLLWHNLSRTHPWAIWYRVDNTGLKQLKNFSSHHLLHFRIQPSLRLMNWLSFFFHVYMMGTLSPSYISQGLQVDNPPEEW